MMKKLPTLALALPLLSLTVVVPARAAKNDPNSEATPDAGRAADKSAAPPPAAGANGGNGANETAPPTAATVDLAKLRAEYDRLRDELFRARARAELVEEGIYASKLGATLRWKGAPDFILHRAEIRLDGNAIWDSGEKPLVDELIKVSERPIKPGPHTVTVKIEVRPGQERREGARRSRVRVRADLRGPRPRCRDDDRRADRRRRRRSPRVRAGDRARAEDGKMIALLVALLAQPSAVAPAARRARVAEAGSARQSPSREGGTPQGPRSLILWRAI